MISNKYVMKACDPETGQACFFVSEGNIKAEARK